MRKAKTERVDAGELEQQKEEARKHMDGARDEALRLPPNKERFVGSCNVNSERTLEEVDGHHT